MIVYRDDGQQMVVAKCVDAHPDDPLHEVGAIEIAEASDKMKLASSYVRGDWASVRAVFQGRRREQVDKNRASERDA